MPAGSVQRWSLSLGRWAGVAVYLHLFFLLFAIPALAFTLPEPDLIVAGCITVAVLFVSLLVHELGHALAANRVGGQVDAIVIGPVGGLLPPRVPDEPEVHLFVALAGPIAHLSLVVVAAIVLAFDQQANVLGLFNPMATSVNLVEGSAWLVATKLTLYLNWVLLLLNLLPAYPFDGGPMLRALLWPALGRRTARVVTSRIAMGVALGFCIWGLFTIGRDFDVRVPPHIPLITLGVMLFFSARQDLVSGQPNEIADENVGYQLDSDGLDLLEAMWSGDDDEHGVLVEHQQHRQQEQRRNLEASEDARVDDILARLHNTSFDSLSREEIEILQRASERYRQKQGGRDGRETSAKGRR
jgi:stage IV sporulation protein FB